MTSAYADKFKQLNVIRVFQTPGGMPAIMARKNWNIPFVASYGYRYDKFLKVDGKHAKAIAINFLTKKVLNKANAVIYTIPETRTFLSRWEDKLVFIPNGVDVNLFKPNASAKRGTITKILFLGRLERQKNLFRLLQAIGELDNIHVTIIGQGSQRAELGEIVADKKLPVTFVKSVTNRELPTYHNSHDIFLLPSLIEGHPKTLLEAMSSAMPIVASRCEGSNVILNNGVTGLACDPYDAKDIAAKIQTLIDDPKKASEYGNNARAFIQQNYEIHTLLEKEVELLTSIAR